MEKLIQVVNRLQDAFAKSGVNNTIELPQIAVVGGQSAGKSSVLENCVGRDFLPRGSGIVTRRPLILQLINSAEEYGEFLHKQGQKFYDFSKIRKEIEDETDRVTGSNKNISPMPISLRIYSPNVLNLTLVDLPGLTKVPVGDQPSDIGAQIRNMVCNFISNKNCLILAVTPANIDVANSDALLLAREVDPNGNRTIGIITKIDIMDRGTNCRDTLMNLTYPLKRGYVGVVNRSQQDIDGRVDIQKAQQLELDFFKTHPSYSDISDKCGTRYMQKILFTQLGVHIKDTLPSIKNSIYDKLQEVTEQLGNDTEDLDTHEGKIKKLMTLLQSFCNQFEASMGFGNENVETNRISHGAAINQILNERYPYEAKKIKSTPEEMRKEISIAIKNSMGVRSTIFTPDVAFTTICKKKIGALKPVSIVMMEKVMEQLRYMLDMVIEDTIAAYPVLAERIKDFVAKSLAEGIKIAKDHLIHQIELETTYVNTNHPDFIKVALGDSTVNRANPNEEEDVRVNLNTESSKIYRKGPLQVISSKVFKSYKEAWFVIKGNQLICYKDELENEIKYNIDLTGCVIRNQRKTDFSLQNKNGAPMIKDMRILELRANTEDEAEDWKASFFARGVYIDGKEKKEVHEGFVEGSDKTESLPGADIDDPNMYRHVEYIRMLVETYLKITLVSHIDIATKIVMCHIIGKIRNDLRSILQAYVYGLDIKEVLREDEGRKEKRQNMVKMQQACRDALAIIGDVSTEVSTQNTVADNYSLASHAKAVKNLNMNGQNGKDYESPKSAMPSRPSATPSNPPRPVPASTRPSNPPGNWRAPPPKPSTPAANTYSNQQIFNKSIDLQILDSWGGGANTRSTNELNPFGNVEFTDQEINNYEPETSKEMPSRRFSNTSRNAPNASSAKFGVRKNPFSRR